MRRVSLRCQGGRYDIWIGRRLMGEVGRHVKGLGLGSRVLVVTNKKVASLFFRGVRRSLSGAGFEVFSYVLPHGNERDKSSNVLVDLWKKMAAMGLERSSTVLALGGGVAGDLAGFAASTYMRGVAVVHVPTTLVAQVDSAIGGKTAIDLAVAKNIVGSFCQPRLVLCDVGALETLVRHAAGRREFRNSFAEVIKYGVIADASLFRLLEARGPDFLSRVSSSGRFGPRDWTFLENVVWKSVRVKAAVVEEDERETRGRRMILNFGHTFAHAFEAASRYRLSHGEAVAVGMISAARLAVRLGMFSPAGESRLMRLVRSFGLPVSLATARLRVSEVLAAMQRDKKKRGGRLRFVLPTRIGRAAVREGVREALVRKIIQGVGVH